MEVLIMVVVVVVVVVAGGGGGGGGGGMEMVPRQRTVLRKAPTRHGELHLHERYIYWPGSKIGGEGAAVLTERVGGAT